MIQDWNKLRPKFERGVFVFSGNTRSPQLVLPGCDLVQHVCVHTDLRLAVVSWAAAEWYRAVRGCAESAERRHRQPTQKVCAKCQKTVRKYVQSVKLLSESTCKVSNFCQKVRAKCQISLRQYLQTVNKSQTVGTNCQITLRQYLQTVNKSQTVCTNSQ